MDLVKEGFPDVADLLRGDVALLEAAKKGTLAKVMKLATPQNINCRDTQGRNSTPLHLAAGYGEDLSWLFQDLDHYYTLQFRISCK